MKKTSTQKKAARRGKLMRLIDAVTSPRKSAAAVIVAAGGSTRMGEGVNKQFIELRGKPVLALTVEAFEKTDGIDYIIVVVRAGDEEAVKELAARYGFKKVRSVIAGGGTRQESAIRGVEALDGDTDMVAIHDGARCLVTPEMITAVLETAKKTGAASAGSPVKDTIKQVSFFNVVENTPDRTKLWAAGTPQIFKAGLYRAAAYYAEKDGAEVTDDNALLERLGGKVTMVDCGYTNIKITTPEDVAVAEALLRYREENGQ